MRMLSLTIDVLQRLKDYTAAVSLARQLLSQRLFCRAQRGYWWDRLALNIDVHLKEPSNVSHIPMCFCFYDDGVFCCFKALRTLL